MKEVRKISNMKPSKLETFAFEVLSLRESMEISAVSMEDYIPNATRGIAKSILSIIADEIEAYKGITDAEGVASGEIRFMLEHAEVENGMYSFNNMMSFRHSLDEELLYKIDLVAQYGFVFIPYKTYYYDAFVEAFVKAVSEILGEPEINKLTEETAYSWQFEVE